MNGEPRTQSDYSPEQIEAAHRVLVDVGQVLAGFKDCIVLVGGWVPGLLISNAREKHVGSIDVDLAVNAAKLKRGRYAEMLKLLLDTGRYHPGPKAFQVETEIHLQKGLPAIKVQIDFMAPKGAKMDRNNPKLFPNFRILEVAGCKNAFHAPVMVPVSGKMISGAQNRVEIQVASLVDAVVLKAYALDGRDKPKDAYDLCYILDCCPAGLASFAGEFNISIDRRARRKVVEILKTKFADLDAFGPMQIKEFYKLDSDEIQEMKSRRAFELVQRFISLME
jgi:hypothetical protein